MSRMQTLLTTMTLLFGMGGSVFADFNDGLVAYKKGDYETAFNEWLPLAEQGIARVQYNLGGLYFEGQGVLKDYKKAFNWYQKSAEQGNDRAQYSLGRMYGKVIKGYGTPVDLDKGAEWIRKSAEQGNAEAQNHLALHYITGTVGLKDFGKAKYWIEKAHKSDDTEVKKQSKMLWNEFELWKY